MLIRSGISKLLMNLNADNYLLAPGCEFRVLRRDPNWPQEHNYYKGLYAILGDWSPQVWEANDKYASTLLTLNDPAVCI